MSTINLTINNHYYGASRTELVKIETILQELLMNQSELAQSLTATAAKVEKIGTETRTLLTKVAELQEAVNNAGNVSPEVQAALESLQAQVAVVDDLVPDAPAGEEQPAE